MNAAGGEKKKGAEGARLVAGSVAPDFALESLKGEVVTLWSLLGRGRPVLLLFMNPHCPPCEALVDDAEEWMSGGLPGLEVAVIAAGSPEENMAKWMAADAGNILVQRAQEVAKGYEAWAPAAVVVREDGRLCGEVGQGVEAVRSMVARMTCAGGG